MMHIVNNSSSLWKYAGQALQCSRPFKSNADWCCWQWNVFSLICPATVIMYSTIRNTKLEDLHRLLGWERR